MGLIENVRKMQEQGMEDKDIAAFLREKGYSPKEVINAISQSKIKAAVEGGSMPQSPESYQNYPQQMPQDYQQQYPQDYPSQSYPQQYPKEQYPQQMPQDYSQYQQGYAYSPLPSESAESSREVAEEIAEEKVSELREQISSLTSSKKEFDSSLLDIEKRLKQLENSFMQLQSAILGKISDYSKDLRNMTDEMHATQDAFKKVVSPVVEKAAKKKRR